MAEKKVVASLPHHGNNDASKPSFLALDSHIHYAVGAVKLGKETPPSLTVPLGGE